MSLLDRLGPLSRPAPLPLDLRSGEQDVVWTLHLDALKGTPAQGLRVIK